MPGYLPMRKAPSWSGWIISGADTEACSGGAGMVDFHVTRRTHSILMNEVDYYPKGHTLDVNKNVYTKKSVARRKKGGVCAGGLTFQEKVISEHYGAEFKGRLSNLLILWSGRPGSNRRRPAWEKGRQLYLKHLFVSETLIRLTQALAVSTTSFLQPCNRGTNEVHSNVLLASIQLPNIPWARNDNGSRSSASHQPRGLNIEFLQQQFTLYRSERKWEKRTFRTQYSFQRPRKTS